MDKNYFFKIEVKIVISGDIKNEKQNLRLAAASYELHPSSSPIRPGPRGLSTHTISFPSVALHPVALFNLQARDQKMVRQLRVSIVRTCPQPNKIVLSTGHNEYITGFNVNYQLLPR